jgi:FtsZ-binding cell division protein ZapB
MTDAEVKKALEVCIDGYCRGCCYGDTDQRHCRDDLMQEALDLINRQEAEIRHLDQESDILQADVENVNRINDELNAENESLIAEIERLWLCIDELKKLVGKHEPNYDPSEEVDTIVQRITILDTPSLQAKIKTEAYKEFTERLKEYREIVGYDRDLKCDIYGSHIHIDIDEFDNLLNELVGDSANIDKQN